MSYNKSVSSINDYIENKIIKNVYAFNKKNNTQIDRNISSDESELDKLEDDINIIKNTSNNQYTNQYTNQPKNYGNLWTEDDRKIILRYLKKNNYSNNNLNLYDESVIQKIAKKTERSEIGIKEEIKKMIFKDYIWNFETYTKLAQKYNIPEHNIKILIKLYLEKYGEKILYPLEIENKILKYQVENIKLKYELRELVNNLN